MSLFILSDKNTIASNYIAELRDVRVQTDSMRFRYNMERLGEILAYELSRKLTYSEKRIGTPLGTASISVTDHYPYLITILRAGIPFFQGFLNYFDKSDAGFIGAYRADSNNKNAVNIDLNYLAAGNFEDRVIILIDPMLATGKSIVKAIDELLKRGKPKKIHVAALIASRQGYEYVKKHTGLPIDFWIADMDKELDDNFYIVPGLGDAGDLSFGKKS